MIKAFVFDIGNVVWQFKPLYTKLFSLWASRLNKSPETFYSDYVVSYQDIETNKLLLNDWLLSLNSQADINLFLSDLDSIFADEKIFNSYCFLDTINLLKKFKSKNIPLICLSNTEPFVYPYLKKFIIDPYFDNSILSWQVGVRKPDPQIYQKIFEFIEAKPDEIIFVDDKPENVISAKSLGINALLFENNQKFFKSLDSY